MMRNDEVMQFVKRLKNDHNWYVYDVGAAGAVRISWDKDGVITHVYTVEPDRD